MSLRPTNGLSKSSDNNTTSTGLVIDAMSNAVVNIDRRRTSVSTGMHIPNGLGHFIGIITFQWTFEQHNNSIIVTFTHFKDELHLNRMKKNIAINYYKYWNSYHAEFLHCDEELTVHKNTQSDGIYFQSQIDFEWVHYIKYPKNFYIFNNKLIFAHEGVDNNTSITFDGANYYFKKDIDYAKEYIDTNSTVIHTKSEVYSNTEKGVSRSAYASTAPILSGYINYVTNVASLIISTHTLIPGSNSWHTKFDATLIFLNNNFHKAYAAPLLRYVCITIMSDENSINYNMSLNITSAYYDDQQCDARFHPKSCLIKVDITTSTSLKTAEPKKLLFGD